MSSSKRYFTAVIGLKENGLYISSSPSSAARKIVSKLCISRKKKQIEFCVRETTKGSKKKTYGPYLVEIKKMKGSRKYKNVVYLKKDRIIQGGFTNVLGEIEFDDFLIQISDPLFAEYVSNSFTRYIFFNPQTVDNIRFYEYVISHQYVLNEFKFKKIDKKNILYKKILDINIDDINTDIFVKLYKFIIQFSSIPETEGLIDKIKNIIIISKKSPKLIQNEVYFYPPIAPIAPIKIKNTRLPLRTIYGLNGMKKNNSPMSTIMTGIPTAVLMNTEYNVLLTTGKTSNEINKESMMTYPSSQKLNNQTDSSPLNTISFSTARRTIQTDRPTIQTIPTIPTIPTISARPTDRPTARPTISARPKIPSGHIKLTDGTIIKDPSLKMIMTNSNKPPIRSSGVISSKTNVAKRTIGSLAGVTESIVPKSVFDNVLTKFFL